MGLLRLDLRTVVTVVALMAAERGAELIAAERGAELIAAERGAELMAEDAGLRGVR